MNVARNLALEKSLIVIVGPTGIGKTRLSIELAKNFNTVVLSSDSRQFYKEMNIGTAKPSSQEMDGVKHYFIDSLSINDDYNAGMFETDSISILETLWKKYDVIILVGGSGLYVNAVCQGFHKIPSRDEILRKKLNEDLHLRGIALLQEQLKNLDPAYYETIDKMNPHRLIRALEVVVSSGKSNLEFKKDKLKKREFKSIKIGLNIERAALYARINLRVDKMLEDGLLEDVKQLFKYKDRQALQTVGYQELFKFIDNEISLEEAIDLIKRNSRRYAKRQLTWFKKDNEIKWFKPNQPLEVLEYIENELKIN